VIIHPSASWDDHLKHLARNGNLVSGFFAGFRLAIVNLELYPWEEAKLQCTVGSEQVALADAEREIVEPWQAAYLRYTQVKCRR
jgi:hypothetical protein